VLIHACPPDRRRRDIDNMLKAPLDAMQHAGVIEDDSLIDDLHIIRQEPIKGGRLVVEITEIAS
jgi:crossover junction endodeoxyribonuclease RusA